MSSLLDDAIVDAKALREAVLRNAEASLLETYAPKIEEAISKLLQEDEELSMDAPIGADGVQKMLDDDEETGATFKSGEEENIGDIDYAVETDLDEGPEMDEEQEFDITRGELKTMLESITKDIQDLQEEMEDEGLEEDDYMEEGHMEDEEKLPMDSDVPLDEAYGMEEEELELDEENIKDIIEALVVDIMPKKRGWAGLPQAEAEHNEELIAAAAQDDARNEKIKDLLKVGKELSEANKKLEASNKKLRETVDSLSHKLEEVNLTNARLFYSNRVLESSSLNERQKNKIVEAISDAGSVNEAKVIFETLQSAAGSTKKEGPKSLSEAVSRPSTILPRKKAQEELTFSERMRILAGIKK